MKKRDSDESMWNLSKLRPVATRVTPSCGHRTPLIHCQVPATARLNWEWSPHTLLVTMAHLFALPKQASAVGGGGDPTTNPIESVLERQFKPSPRFDLSLSQHFESPSKSPTIKRGNAGPTSRSHWDSQISSFYLSHVPFPSAKFNSARQLNSSVSKRVIIQQLSWSFPLTSSMAASDVDPLHPLLPSVSVGLLLKTCHGPCNSL